MDQNPKHRNNSNDHEVVSDDDAASGVGIWVLLKCSFTKSIGGL